MIIALVIDATLVRMLLVSALVQLMGPATGGRAGHEWSPRPSPRPPYASTSPS
ncbi:hypothetical protein [Nocardia thraciensis]